MPGLLKIGKTTISPDQRALQISASTGVPTEFKVAYYKHCYNCHDAELSVHRELHKYRVNDKREFFKADIDYVKLLVDQQQGFPKDPLQYHGFHHRAITNYVADIDKPKSKKISEARRLKLLQQEKILHRNERANKPTNLSSWTEITDISKYSKRKHSNMYLLKIYSLILLLLFTLLFIISIS